MAWQTALVGKSLLEIPQLVLAELLFLPDTGIETCLAHLNFLTSNGYMRPSLRKMFKSYLILLQSADKTWPSDDKELMEGIENMVELLSLPL